MLNGLEPRLVVEPEKDPTAAVPAWFVSSPDSFDWTVSEERSLLDVELDQAEDEFGTPGLDDEELDESEALLRSATVDGAELGWGKIWNKNGVNKRIIDSLNSVS
jgi:hypothetical protein